MSHKYPVTFFTEIYPSSSLRLCPCPAHRTPYCLPARRVLTLDPVLQRPCPGAGKLPLTTQSPRQITFAPPILVVPHPIPNTVPLDPLTPSPFPSQRWSMSRFGGSPRGSSSGKTLANLVSRGAMRGSLSLTKRSPEGESSARNISLSSRGARISNSAREMMLTPRGKAARVRGSLVGCGVSSGVLGSTGVCSGKWSSRVRQLIEGF